jgi:hypothetical protein
MEHGCEHIEGSPIGKCAICERTVCTECYNEVFGAMICDLHAGLEDDSEWELVAFFSDATLVTPRRYVLEENGITSLVVDHEDEAVELYVPNDEKEDAFASLLISADEETTCGECRILFAKELDSCPICGSKPMDIEEYDQLNED